MRIANNLTVPTYSPSARQAFFDLHVVLLQAVQTKYNYWKEN